MWPCFVGGAPSSHAHLARYIPPRSGPSNTSENLLEDVGSGLSFTTHIQKTAKAVAKDGIWALPFLGVLLEWPGMGGLDPCAFARVGKLRRNPSETHLRWTK